MYSVFFSRVPHELLEAIFHFRLFFRKNEKNGQKSSIHPVDLSWFHHPRGSGMVPRHLRRDPKVAVFPQEVEEYPGYSLKPEEFPGFRNLGYTKAYKV